MVAAHLLICNILDWHCQELRMRDVECMLLDYQAHMRGGRAAGAPAEAPGMASRANGVRAGRFCHCHVADVRLSDVTGLQLGYQAALHL